MTTAGFPHSDTPGSKLACQLPGAYRRLQRPSSPVVAKASTTCTFSLDPITLSAVCTVHPDHRGAWRHYGRLSRNARNAISNPVSPVQKYEPDPPCFFRIVKEQPISWKTHGETRGNTFAVRCALGSGNPGGANRDRTGDLLLAKQALSQLSYGPVPGSIDLLFLKVGVPVGVGPMVGLDGFEPSTPALSRRCSNQLSYRPFRLAID